MATGWSQRPPNEGICVIPGQVLPVDGGQYQRRAFGWVAAVADRRCKDIRPCWLYLPASTI
jgi:hypothetical protein